jgi:RNA polymerase sigma factor (sigma-70 family)
VGSEQAGILLRDLCRLAARRAGDFSDRELMRRFLTERDESAFEALVRRHGPMVLHVCRRTLRDEHDAEDAFQATFLVLARKAATLQRHESVGNWLYGVATRLALRARADAARRRDRERRATPKGGRDPLAELTVREAQQVLDEELIRLPAKYRASLVLCCLEGLTRDEAAQRLGCRPATLKSRLERARALLRRRLAGRGLVFPAAWLASLLAGGLGEAAVPAPLLRSTVQAATAFAVGSGAGSLVSPTTIALAEGAVTWSSVSKFQVAALLLLATLACASGAGLVLNGASKPEWPDGRFELASAPGADRGAVTGAPLAAAHRSTERPGPPRVAPALDRDLKVPAALTGWKEQATLAGHQHGTRALAFSADGSRLVSGGNDGRVRIWDVGAARELLTLSSAQVHQVWAVAFGRGASAVAAGHNDGTVVVWDLRRPKDPEVAFPNFAPEVRSLRFCADRQALTWARSDGTVEREARQGGQVVAPPGRGGRVACVAFSTDGRTVAWGMHDGSVRPWDVAAKKEQGRFPMHRHPVLCVAFSADGRTAASVDHFGTAKVWDARTGQEQVMVQVPSCPVDALALSPDARLLATGAFDCAVRVWDTKSGRQLAHLVEHRGPLHSLAFSSDGQLLASASSDGTIKLWTPAPVSTSNR